jgi:hypothetical protein
MAALFHALHRPALRMRALRLLGIAVLSIAAPRPATAQLPRVDVIDFFGQDSLRTEVLARALRIHAGDSLPRSFDAARRRLEALEGVAEAVIEAVCCSERGGTILYVGIRRDGQPRLERRDAPTGTDSLPEIVMLTYGRFTEAVYEAIRRGDTADDLAEGHSLMADPAARALQIRFIDLARQHRPRLRRVLRDSADPDQRAVAVTVIAYAGRKADVIPDLEYAVGDPDPDVRNNATRALWAIATLATGRPDLGIRIDPAPFIDMLHSVHWTDRNKALLVLAALTQSRDSGVLTALREHALVPLAEMARWTEPGHAMAAYMILGRIQGLDDETIFARWTAGDRAERVREMIDAIRAGRGR